MVALTLKLQVSDVYRTLIEWGYGRSRVALIIVSVLLLYIKKFMGFIMLFLTGQ